MIKTKQNLKERLKLNKRQLKGMIMRAKKARAKGYDIILSMAKDLSVSPEEIVKALEKNRIIGMTENSKEKAMKLTRSKLKEIIREVINEKTNYIGPFVFSDRTDKEELLDVVARAVDGYSNYRKGMQFKKSDYKKAYQTAEKILKKKHGMTGNEIDRETRRRK